MGMVISGIIPYWGFDICMGESCIHIIKSPYERVEESSNGCIQKTLLHHRSPSFFQQ